MSLARRIWAALTQNTAATAPDAEDPRLRGRTYAIPFERVWTAAITLAGARLRNWNLLEFDDYDGTIRAEAMTRFPRATVDITIRIVLDANAQTRVDAQAANRGGRGDLGASTRLLVQFFRALDASIAEESSRPVDMATP